MRKASNIMYTIISILAIIVYLFVFFLYLALANGNINFVIFIPLIYIALLIVFSIIRGVLMESNQLGAAGVFTLIILLPAGVIPGVVCGIFTFMAEEIPNSSKVFSLNELYEEKLRFERIQKNNPSAWSESQIKICEERINTRKKEVEKCLKEIEEDYDKEKLSESEYSFYKESYLKELDAEKQYLKELNSNL